MDLWGASSLSKYFKTLNTKHSMDIQKHSIVCFNININNAMSSYAEFEVPVIGEHLEICANGDKSLWKRRQRKGVFFTKS